MLNAKTANATVEKRYAKKEPPIIVQFLLRRPAATTILSHALIFSGLWLEATLELRQRSKPSAGFKLEERIMSGWLRRIYVMLYQHKSD